MTTESNHLTESVLMPGAELNKAREKAGRSLADVAHEMHMNVWQLEALENDDYHKLAGSVFVQGYIRSYARLLELDAEPLLKAYFQQRGDQEPRWEINPPIEESAGKSIWLPLSTALITAALVAAFVIWLNANGYLGTGFGYQDDASNELSPPLGNVEQVVLEGVSENSVNQATLALPDQTPAGHEPQTDSAADTALTAEPLTDSAPNLPATDEPQQPANELTAEVGQPAPVAPANQPEPDAEKASISQSDSIRSAAMLDTSEPVSRSDGGSLGMLNLSFEEDSWVEVRDASGRLLIHGLRKAGVSAQIDGRPPYQVFLGNAPGVKIEIDNERFDTTPYVRDNRTARFLLQQN